MTGAQPPRVPFNRPALTGRELENIAQVLESRRFSGGGPFARSCAEWLNARHPSAAAFVTPACTHALEAAALLSDLEPGDEVILPSFAFTSTATAFARAGARLVFVDVDPGTMNLDPDCAAAAIGPRSRVLVVLHYAGIACEMESLMALAERHDLVLVEDAAQALLCSYRDRPLGTFGNYGCFSFHETKNIQCGEGGALLVREAADVPWAEVVLEKGANRARFLRGEVDKYTWTGLGSSYVLSELSAAVLQAQLDAAEAIIADRLESWQRYWEALLPLAEAGHLELPSVPEGCRHNGHIFYVKAAGEAERDALMDFVKARGVQAVFHYVPLHSAPAGRRYGRFAGADRFTTRESGRLLRLPLYYGLSESEAAQVVEAIGAFYGRANR